MVGVIRRFRLALFSVFCSVAVLPSVGHCQFGYDVLPANPTAEDTLEISSGWILLQLWYDSITSNVSITSDSIIVDVRFYEANCLANPESIFWNPWVYDTVGPLTKGEHVLVFRYADYKVCDTILFAYSEGETGHPLTILPAPCDGCVAGDFSADKSVSISDVTALISFIFSAGPGPYCEIAADADGSGSITISDVLVIIQHIFAGVPLGDCGD